MCVIIIKQKKNIISSEVLENSASLNPHGLGITFLDTFETTYHESDDYDALITERPFIAHFRYATVGKIGPANTHPFACGKQGHELLMQNGTIKGLGTKAKCDSKVLAENLGNMPRSKWKEELEQHDSRFVTINTEAKTFEIYNRKSYTKHDGIWYSKANVLKRNLVAVYGTLKRGHSNHLRHLGSERFMGSGKTQTKYPLVVSGLPYLQSTAGLGHHVEVEVFKVSDNTFSDLDILEGHPEWYIRQRVPITMSDGQVLTCWVYFNDTNNFRGAEHHKSYEPHRPRLHIENHAPEPSCSSALWRDSGEDDAPFCVDCYNDLVMDDYPGGTFTCTGCGSHFTEKEVVEFNF
mgnify:CR=1 FL=1